MTAVIVKGAAIIAVLAALVAAGHYGLGYVEPGHREGLATLIGAAATIFAGWLAWESLAFQARRAEQAKAQLAKSRKEDAVIAIARAVEVAAILCKTVSKEIWIQGPGPERTDRTKKAANHLDQVFGREMLQSLTDALEGEDRVDFLMIIFQLHRVLALSEYKTKEVLSVDDLKEMRRALDNFADILARFDNRLHAAFVKVAGQRDQADRVRGYIAE